MALLLRSSGRPPAVDFRTDLICRLHLGPGFLHQAAILGILMESLPLRRAPKATAMYYLQVHSDREECLLSAAAGAFVSVAFRFRPWCYLFVEQALVDERILRNERIVL